MDLASIMNATDSNMADLIITPADNQANGSDSAAYTKDRESEAGLALVQMSHAEVDSEQLMPSPGLIGFEHIAGTAEDGAAMETMQKYQSSSSVVVTHSGDESNEYLPRWSQEPSNDLSPFTNVPTPEPPSKTSINELEALLDAQDEKQEMDVQENAQADPMAGPYVPIVHAPTPEPPSDVDWDDDNDVIQAGEKAAAEKIAAQNNVGSMTSTIDDKLKDQPSTESHAEMLHEPGQNCNISNEHHDKMDVDVRDFGNPSAQHQSMEAPLAALTTDGQTSKEQEAAVLADNSVNSTGQMLTAADRPKQDSPQSEQTLVEHQISAELEAADHADNKSGNATADKRSKRKKSFARIESPNDDTYTPDASAESDADNDSSDSDVASKRKNKKRKATTKSAPKKPEAAKPVTTSKNAQKGKQTVTKPNAMAKKAPQQLKAALPKAGNQTKKTAPRPKNAAIKPVAHNKTPAQKSTEPIIVSSSSPDSDEPSHVNFVRKKPDPNPHPTPTEPAPVNLAIRASQTLEGFLHPLTAAELQYLQSHHRLLHTPLPTPIDLFSIATRFAHARQSINSAFKKLFAEVNWRQPPGSERLSAVLAGTFPKTAALLFGGDEGAETISSKAVAASGFGLVTPVEFVSAVCMARIVKWVFFDDFEGALGAEVKALRVVRERVLRAYGGVENADPFLARFLDMGLAHAGHAYLPSIGFRDGQVAPVVDACVEAFVNKLMDCEHAGVDGVTHSGWITLRGDLTAILLDVADLGLKMQMSEATGRKFRVEIPLARSRFEPKRMESIVAEGSDVKKGAVACAFAPMVCVQEPVNGEEKGVMGQWLLISKAVVKVC